MVAELIGSIIDRRYRVERKIGEGGMGAVYQGEHVEVGNKIAIKVLHDEYSRDVEVVRRLKQEARVAGTLGHKNIVQVFDFSQMDDGTHYLVMEFLEGETLADYLAREGPVSPRFILPVALQVLDALVAAHSRGIIHRDLKPENVFLTTGADPHAHVKVLDFGISKMRVGGDDLHLTKTGTVLGTPYFMSPEQASGKKDIDARTDIYALGVILYQALTGQYPFTGDTYNELIINIFSSEPPPPHTVRPDLPQEVEDVILKSMAKHREDRFADAREFAAALGALINDPRLKEIFGGMSKSALMRSAQRTALSSAPPPPPMGLPRPSGRSVPEALADSVSLDTTRSRTGLWVALAVLVLAAGAVGAYLAFGRGGGTADASPDAAASAAAALDASIGLAARPLDAGAASEKTGPEDAVAAEDAAPIEEEADAAAEVAAPADDVAGVPPNEVVVVRVRTVPPGASIKRDDVEVENPYEGKFVRGGADIKIEVEARGYATDVRYLHLDQDQDVEVVLLRPREVPPHRDAGAARPEAGEPPPPPPPPPPADAGRPDTGRPGIDTNNPFTSGRRDAGIAPPPPTP
ncbi:MAG: serine/threonine protein kinase [Deltaproteobacteria bacterium]|nr:serine/threonine protein kinase [Deltaproteobacteria bacterium]